eukprot:scaffold18151_cov112-Isochrysis_galbana.AAC.3
MAYAPAPTPDAIRGAAAAPDAIRGAAVAPDAIRGAAVAPDANHGAALSRGRAMDRATARAGCPWCSARDREGDLVRGALRQAAAPTLPPDRSPALAAAGYYADPHHAPPQDIRVGRGGGGCWRRERLWRGSLQAAAARLAACRQIGAVRGARRLSGAESAGCRITGAAPAAALALARDGGAGRRGARDGLAATEGGAQGLALRHWSRVNRRAARGGAVEARYGLITVQPRLQEGQELQVGRGELPELHGGIAGVAEAARHLMMRLLRRMRG